MSLAERHYGLPKFFGNLAAMNEPAVQLKHLADVVLRRRTWLGLRQDQMKDLGGPSTTTMTKVENASPPAPSADTLRKLDHSLLWEPGSAKTVLYGGEPTSNDSTIPFERRDARLAKAFAAESKIVELLLDLAIEADEVDHSASLLDTNVDDTEGAEQLASDVDSLLIDIDRLTQRIHDEALEAVGGDSWR